MFDHYFTWKSWKESSVFPTQNFIFLFRLSLQEFENYYEECFASLNDVEQKKAAQYKISTVKLQFVATRVSLRYLLQKINFNKSIAYGEYGKPLLEGFTKGEPRLYFNLSHSAEEGLIVLSDVNEVGIDIEKRIFDRNWRGISEKNFGASENHYVLSANSEEESVKRFYQLWTLKEALVKCEGRALLQSLQEIDLLQASSSLQNHFFYQDYSLWSFQDENSKYSAALALKSREPVQIHPFILSAQEIRASGFFDKTRK